MVWQHVVSYSAALAAVSEKWSSYWGLSFGTWSPTADIESGHAVQALGKHCSGQPQSSQKIPVDSSTWFAGLAEDWSGLLSKALELLLGIERDVPPQ